MTLKKYLQILSKRIWLFIITIIIVMCSTYLFTIFSPENFNGSLSVYTLITQQKIPQDQSDFYKYDNYYALQSSEIFANTVITWLKDPANVSTIYTQADELLPEVGLKKYSKLITAKKNEPTAVQISIQSNNQESVSKLIDSTKQFIVDKTQEWKNKGLLENTNLDISNPIIIKEKPSITLNMGIALIVSIVLGLALVYFSEYMQSKD